MNIVVVVGLLVTVLTGAPVLMQLRGHPRGLFVLFFAEMWERFSYYGMRALLIYYLTDHFLFSDDFSQGQYAAYTTLVFLMPLLGGFLADRYLGTRKAVVFGALLLVAGHFTMAIEGPSAVQTLTYAGHSYPFQVTGRMNDRAVCLQVDHGCHAVKASADGGLKIAGLPPQATLPASLPKGGYSLAVEKRNQTFVNIFYLALALIVMGVGYLKANISSIVGQLYQQGDARRDPGFTLYYFGINLGSFWATALCGLLGQTIGWWAGFGLAGIGMLAGFLVFVWGKPLLEGHGEPPDPAALRKSVIGPINLEAAIYLGGLVGVAVAWWLVQRYAAMGVLQIVTWVAVSAYLGWYMITKINRVARDRMILALVLIIASIVFWTLFEQAGSSLSLFAARNTQLPHQGFVSINAAQTQSFNPGFLLIFAPVFAALWPWLAKRGRDPNPAIKFGLALLQVGAGFLVLVAGAPFADAQYRLPIVFLALAYLLHTTGEFCLSPVGLSQMTKLAPAVLISTVMAVWYLSISWAEWIGGFIAQLAGSETVGGQVLDPKAALASSLHVFTTIGWAAVVAGGVFLALSPLMKRWAHGASDSFAPLEPPLAPEPLSERAAPA